MTSRQIAEQKELLDSLREEEKALALESQTMDAARREMWRGAPLEPLTPEAMTTDSPADTLGRRHRHGNPLRTSSIGPYWRLGHFNAGQKAVREFCVAAPSKSWQKHQRRFSIRRAV